MIYLIASHNTRIQCLINLIKPLKGKQIRFKNCCVIRIEFNESEGEIDVKLVYSGSLGDSEKKNIFKRPYYVALKDLPERVVPESQLPNTPDDELDGYPIPTSKPYQYSSPELAGYTMVNGDPVPNSQLNPERFPDGSMSLKGGIKFSNPFKWGTVPEESRVSLEQKLDFTITETTTPSLAEVLDKLKPVGIESHENPLAKGRHIFYIVRHGQALHNVKKPNIFPDTDLTTDGRHQAKLAGEALLEIMKQSNELPDVLLVSDLKRTHQTLAGIITNMLLASQYDRVLHDKIKKLDEQEFVILPCASELSESSNDGKCDLSTAMVKKTDVFSGIYAPENFPSCTKADTQLQKKCSKINDHGLNWSYYLRFYGEAMRFELGRTSKPTGIVRHCRDTNMLYNVLEFMKIYANPVHALSQPMGSPLSTPFRGGKTKRKKNRRTRKTNRRI